MLTRLPILLLLLLLTAFSLRAQPDPCGPIPAMTPTCLEACVICDIDGFTGRNTSTIPGQGFSNFCTTEYNRMAYIAFIAGTENLEIDFTVSNCTINWGLEVGIFESFDCQTFVPVTVCDTDVQPGETLTLSNTEPLVVGQHYYLVMDGSAGDECDWTFSVVSGSTAVGQLTSSGDIIGNAATCPDLPTTYTVTNTEVGAALFYWTVDETPQAGTSPTIDVTYPTDGTYQLCVTAANVCDEAPPTCITVDVTTPEVLTLVEAICDNDCYEVAGQAICESGNYDFVVPLPNGCDSLIFLDLTVLPQAQELVDINLCVGEEFLVGTTPYSTTGVFVDTILTAASCDSIVTLDLFMVECEIIGSTDFAAPICNGAANGMLIFSVENGTPPFDYIWEHITDEAIGGEGSTLLFENNQITGVPAGLYEINVMDDFGNNVVLFQEVFDPPVLSVTAEAVDLNGFSLSCHGGADGTALAAGAGGVPPYAYAWSDTQLGEQAGDLAAGTYEVSVTDANGCVQSTNVTLTEPTPVTLIVNYLDPTCDGFETGIIQLDSAVGGTPPYTFALNDGPFGTITTYTDLGAGSYDFIALDANACETRSTGTLAAPDIPVLFMGEPPTVALGCAVTLPVQTNNTTLVDIQWTGPEGTLDCPTCLRPNAAPLDAATYVLTVTSVDGCVATDSVRVTVDKVRDVFVPNAFSPNGDGVNDFFAVNANKSVAIVRSIEVYDRWGALVFSDTDLPPNDPTRGWDGRFLDKELNPGVYLWTIEVEYLDGELIRYGGDVALLK